MIIHVDKKIGQDGLERMQEQLRAHAYENDAHYVLITSASLKELNGSANEHVLDSWVFPNDLQLASRAYRKETREISINGKVTIGGSTNNCMMITGPCSVESEEQLESAAKLCVELGITTLRGGCYKPRTSPYSFQGLGLEGLQLLAKMRDKYGLNIITEVRDATHVEEVIEHTDVVQIGAKAMYDHGILRRCGKARKPILLKRGFGSTLQECVQAAEFILSAGNEDVMICERGIRTFETKTRFTLDLCGVAWLKEHTNLPIILDPSHALGYRYGIADLTRACVAMGIDGLLIETHPDPSVAKSDAAQQLDFDQFTEMNASLSAVAKAVGRTMV